MNDNLFHFSLFKACSLIINNLNNDLSKIIDASLGENTEINKVVSKGDVKYRVIVKTKDSYILKFITSDKNHLKSNKLAISDTNNILDRAIQIDGLLHAEKKRIEENFSKFTHNLKTLCTMSMQDIEYFSPIGSTGDFNISKLSDWKIFISELESSDKEDLAKTMMRTYKNMQHILNDIGIYEDLYIDSADRLLRITDHSIHKIVTRSVLCCASLLLEKNVTIEFGKADWPVRLDYESTQVALFYVMDNIIKYTKPKTKVTIDFHKNKTTKKTSVHFIMESLFVNDHEVEKIFEEGYSGEQAILSNLSGKGLGMFTARKLLNDNNATIKFIPKGTMSYEFLNRQYGENKIIIEFP